MKKIRPFRLSDETVAKLDTLCAGNRTDWIERVIEAKGNLGGLELSEKAKARIKEKAGKLDLSESTVLEMAVMEFGGGSGHAQGKLTTAIPSHLRNQFPYSSFPISTPDRTPFIAPKGSFSKEDLKEMLRSGQIGNSGLPADTPLADTPHAPFDFKDEEGNPHRVRAYGKTLKVCFLRDGVEEPIRNLREGELETLWERRIQ